MRLLQINTVVNSGSIGRIAEEIGDLVIKNGWMSYIAYGRGKNISNSNKIRITNSFQIYFNVLRARLFDCDGFVSNRDTFQLIKQIKFIKPDIIHLHNLHGYYINMAILFEFLNTTNIKIVWTLHDCWAFTGHCTYFDYANCRKWQTNCNSCPQKSEYPKSIFLDKSYRNYRRKIKLLSNSKNLTIVTPSNWLFNLVSKSFLSNHRIKVINNGINLSIFKPSDLTNKSNRKIILGVANIWNERKGLKYFIELAKSLSEENQIVLIGLTKGQLKTLPSNIIGVERTENIQELINFYSSADVFVNPTLEDNFPTTNLEALACGTPVVTFNTGGSIESINGKTGLVVEKNDIEGLQIAINEILLKGKEYYSSECRKHAENLYNSNIKNLEYFELYKQLLNDI